MLSSRIGFYHFNHKYLKRITMNTMRKKGHCMHFSPYMLAYTEDCQTEHYWLFSCTGLGLQGYTQTFAIGCFVIFSFSPSNDYKNIQNSVIHSYFWPIYTLEQHELTKCFYFLKKLKKKESFLQHLPLN